MSWKTMRDSWAASRFYKGAGFSDREHYAARTALAAERTERMMRNNYRSSFSSSYRSSYTPSFSSTVSSAELARRAAERARKAEAERKRKIKENINWQTKYDGAFSKWITELESLVDTSTSHSLPTHKECPKCFETIKLEATRCKHCHAELDGVADAIKKMKADSERRTDAQALLRKKRLMRGCTSLLELAFKVHMGIIHHTADAGKRYTPDGYRDKAITFLTAVVNREFREKATMVALPHLPKPEENIMEIGQTVFAEIDRLQETFDSSTLLVVARVQKKDPTLSLIIETDEPMIAVMGSGSFASTLRDDVRAHNPQFKDMPNERFSWDKRYNPTQDGVINVGGQTKYLFDFIDDHRLKIQLSSHADTSNGDEYLVFVELMVPNKPFQLRLGQYSFRADADTPHPQVGTEAEEQHIVWSPTQEIALNSFETLRLDIDYKLKPNTNPRVTDGYRIRCATRFATDDNDHVRRWGARIIHGYANLAANALCLGEFETIYSCLQFIEIWHMGIPEEYEYGYMELAWPTEDGQVYPMGAIMDGESQGTPAQVEAQNRLSQLKNSLIQTLSEIDASDAPAVQALVEQTAPLKHTIAETETAVNACRAVTEEWTAQQSELSKAESKFSKARQPLFKHGFKLAELTLQAQLDGELPEHEWMEAGLKGLKEKRQHEDRIKELDKASGFFAVAKAKAEQVAIHAQLLVLQNSLTTVMGKFGRRVLEEGAETQFACPANQDVIDQVQAVRAGIADQEQALAALRQRIDDQKPDWCARLGTSSIDDALLKTEHTTRQNAFTAAKQALKTHVTNALPALLKADAGLPTSGPIFDQLQQIGAQTLTVHLGGKLPYNVTASTKFP